MEVRTLTCIGCPLGCQVSVTLGDAGEIVRIEGNTCKTGEDYARKEVANPMRMVTSTVRVRGSKTGAVMVSCKTRTDVPKSRIFDVVQDIKDITLTAPVHIGDVVKANVAGTGVDMVATKEIV
jgi:CxxC motif-containing protein